MQLAGADGSLNRHLLDPVRRHSIFRILLVVCSGIFCRKARIRMQGETESPDVAVVVADHAAVLHVDIDRIRRQCIAVGSRHRYIVFIPGIMDGSGRDTRLDRHHLGRADRHIQIPVCPSFCPGDRGSQPAINAKVEPDLGLVSVIVPDDTKVFNRLRDGLSHQRRLRCTLNAGPGPVPVTLFTERTNRLIPFVAQLPCGNGRVDRQSSALTRRHTEAIVAGARSGSGSLQAAVNVQRENDTYLVAVVIADEAVVLDESIDGLRHERALLRVGDVHNMPGIISVFVHGARFFHPAIVKRANANIGVDRHGLGIALCQIVRFGKIIRAGHKGSQPGFPPGDQLDREAARTSVGVCGREVINLAAVQGRSEFEIAIVAVCVDIGDLIAVCIQQSGHSQAVGVTHENEFP